MASLNYPYTFTNGTTADANQVMSDLNAVKTFVEGSVVQTDGSVQAPTAAIADGAITAAKLATATIQLLTPTGSITAYAGSSASVPSGWLLCDGTAVSQTTYAALYAVIGSAYNTSGGQVAPSAGTFRVPLLTGRVPVGRVAGDPDFGGLGDTGGAKDSFASHFHTADGTLSAAANGDHNHGGLTIGAGGHHHTYQVQGVLGGNPVDPTYVFAGGTPTNSFNTDSVGDHQHGINGSGTHVHDVTGNTSTDGTANGNLQPYIVVNYLIKI